ncbi:hypothetical protein [Rugosimonospora africana]|nr:hypothetical protein [Rugosimonospora africana]
MNVELVDHVVGAPAPALADPDELPVGLGDDHQTIGHGRADLRLVPPAADLFISGRSADQGRVVRSNVCLAESADGRDIVVPSVSHDRFVFRRHRTLPQPGPTDGVGVGIPTA